jgi:hypothetical protein
VETQSKQKEPVTEEQKNVLPFKQRPKYDEIIIYARHESKIYFNVSSVVTSYKLRLTD